MVVKNWRMSTQGDSGNFLKHWNCSGACAMPPSIAKQPVVFAPRHFVPTDDAMTHLYIHIYIYMTLLYNSEDHRIPVVRASEVSHWDAVKYCDLD